ncbi:hypothetical protein [Algoriphagus marinus]|uniref:hypothetical protein n=1 Tax=Algoriphagus marinus TaxID=1925762 RepID=UPI00094B8845|nr:hypothetical protein [Algoriphagus marinus]
MNNLFVITLIDHFQCNPIELSGGFFSRSQAADYLDQLVNHLADQDYEIRRRPSWIEVSNLVTIQIKPTNQIHWQRSDNPEDLREIFESDIEKVINYISESEERLIQFHEELVEIEGSF